ncbi:MAG: ATP-binding protein [Bacteroidia bacterium]|nr:ATP-binding protein [Bacteroidia bacterium]
MKSYRIWLLFRLVLIMTTMAAIVWLGLEEGFIGLPALLTTILGVQIWLLFRYLDRSELLLKRFFESVAYDDFTARFTHQRSAPYAGLEHSLDQVMEQFRGIRAEKEEGYLYLEAVIHHLGVPTLAIRDDELIHFSNPAAKRLFDRPRLMKVTDLGLPLSEHLGNLAHGEKKAFRYHRGDEVVPLLVSATRFHLREHHYQLVSFQDIRREVDQAETEAWQRLTRVLRHEILNSLTPVTTLTRTLEHMLFLPAQGELRSREDLHNRRQDIKEALGVIHRRSEGLMNFVQTYREVTKLPQPQWEEVRVCELISDVRQLFSRRFQEGGIQLSAHCFPESLIIQADPSLLEQVLINLVLNAREAISDQPGSISMEARLSGKTQLEISVTDTGPGISPEISADIFTPFFTTKAEGSGIGLSVSRQIMMAHGGELIFSSKPGEGARFVMRLELG